MLKEKCWDGKTTYPFQELAVAFVEKNELTSKFSRSEKRTFEKDLATFINSIKESLAEEVRMESLRKQVETELECMFDDYGKKIYEIIPKEVINEVVTEWRNEVARRSDPHNFNGDMLRSILRSKSWCNRSRYHSDEEQKLYILYLKEWYRIYMGGSPSCIDDFLDGEMRNGYIAPKYWNMLKSQENPRRLSRADSDKIGNIVRRAETLDLLFFEKELATAFIEMATVHYDMDLDFMLNCSEFDFLHDFAQIPQHFDCKSGTFDERFIPRAAKRSLR